MPGSGRPALLAAVTTVVPVVALFAAIGLGRPLEPSVGLATVAFLAVVIVLFGGVFRLRRALP